VQEPVEELIREAVPYRLISPLDGVPVRDPEDVPPEQVLLVIEVLLGI